MHRLSRVAISIVATFAIVGSGCSGGSDLTNAVDSVAESYLAPSYDEATSELPSLTSAVLAACAARDQSSLAAVRSAWIDAQLSWKTTQAGWFGPTTMDRHDSAIGQEPTSPEGIEATLASDATLDVAYVTEALPTTQRGLGAIEYIVFGDQPLDERRCEYVNAVARSLANESDQLRASWFDSWDGGSAFLGQFTGAAGPAMTSREALGDQVGAIIEILKLVTLQQLGRELGITSPAPVPGAYPEGEAGIGLESLLAQVGGVATAYGVSPASIAGAIESRSLEVNATISDLLTQSTNLVALISADHQGNMASAAESDAERLEQVYRLLAELRTAFETDVVSLLDLTLGFSDSDGDTG